MLANRLRFILPKTSSLQGAFASNRYIYDNILIAHEILSTFSRNRSKGGYIASKLDMEKTYGRLDYNFIGKCFDHIGFLDME